METVTDLRTPLTVKQEGKVDRVIEKPLRALRKNKGKGRCREGLDSIALLTQVEQRMGAAQDMDTFLKVRFALVRQGAGVKAKVCKFSGYCEYDKGDHWL